MSSSSTNPSIYSQTTIGSTLSDTLRELVEESLIDESLVPQILKEFDHTMSQSLKELINSKISVQGMVKRYNFCENQWAFLIDKHANIKINGQEVSTEDVLKMISVQEPKIIKPVYPEDKPKK
eukprot:TRINITY_DN5560_c0_g1_i1.p1 TRINITY_DN5560_c0_g1~~TRINITY_DN5560_c0_g1_i1.p1  ORF type:complete len:123 (-),score=53.09 TRINITY_DN5560_c0_g1_i1:47-415(-)